MLRKLLKYDLRSILKFWWIAALISVVIAVAGGGCITILNAEKELPVAILAMSGLFLMLAIFSLFILNLLTMLLNAVRFYKNFFTDEGYLTFTLPVKKSQLLNSKLITSIVTQGSTALLCTFNVILMLCIGFYDEIFTPELIDHVIELFEDIYQSMDFYSVVCILQLIVLSILIQLFSILFLYCCITFASIITKRAKVVAAIGIYYGANSIFSFIIQLLYVIGLSSLSSWMYVVPSNYENITFTLLLMCLIFFIAVFCALLYILQYWMLDRKLNLS